ncbi:dienelactone hydrolase [Serinibacter arcticus]|uniref:Dienelactone hydrolase n=1 Tax=Serinibacter arcticus TaxID=1655435 RepID=A0A2U1ZVM1_9MICO|nr:alpha/beta family hydrolase [Serinibacter arcticus]PWD50990.1 dienelactone hydrolase [Serinibacter arcticus]
MSLHAAPTPLDRRPAGLVVLPGAGGGRDNRTLVALERGLGDALPIVRAEFPNRTAGRSGPERPAVAVAHVRELVVGLAAELGVPTSRIAVGGRSFGGRMASIAVADGLEVAGLALLSYPLHPPGRPGTLRTEHLPRITAPTLAVSGERDPFGNPAELAEHLAVIPGGCGLVLVTGNHSPADGPVVAAVRDWLG